MRPKKVLFVVTSTNKIPDSEKSTGLWIEEFAAPYFLLTDRGVEVTIVSPKGGVAPIDPKSRKPEFTTEAVTRFFGDSKAQEKLNTTLKLADVESDQYDAIFYPGGHGPMWDLPENEKSIALIESFYNESKPVALVCHAPAALKNVKGKDGQPLVAGKKVAGFTNSEEIAGQSTAEVPFMLEDMLKDKKAIYQKGADWQPFMVFEGNLITGQNPASSILVAEKILADLNVQ
ncbi:type 1 glutamine amidotransferase domain-containing protein [Dyadobacter sp. CY312]|uniref:type 1 glutamine amidotransferase domain-containing protein n=1 Tax=Dyadobacter sp. CY312 TaxID=2907303 RepID=UPI001F1634DB|nr:type 1 glutamine amidotransferase domain-containing protein [Dyadobacter sp. CY312]MCE7041328.1 type 1 glutamine amidotransferase domain-containing protein [Dyadobacter sp. CY312]